MNNSIVLTLHKPQIIESVKNETFIRGSFDKAADQKATSLAYVEQAGDENYQNRLLVRSLSTSLEELKTNLSDYISANGSSSGDNIFLDEDDYMISITLVVGERFNHAYTESLARLSAKYIEETMLMDWWKPINEKQSSLYSKFVERDLAAIKRCFNKTAPQAPDVPYTTILNVTGSALDIGIGEEHTVTYSISDGAIDDIEVLIEDTTLIGAGRTSEGFTIIGKRLGHTYIQLYSRHNPELNATIHVYVTDQA
jgi:uncharacterized protein YbcC (UPF0753/DUF2309 family)